MQRKTRRNLQHNHFAEGPSLDTFHASSWHTRRPAAGRAQGSAPPQRAAHAAFHRNGLWPCSAAWWGRVASEMLRFSALWLYLNRFVAMGQCQRSRATQLCGSELQSCLFLSPKPQLPGGLALVCRLLLPGKASGSVVGHCAFRDTDQTNRKTLARPQAALPGFSPLSHWSVTVGTARAFLE